MQTPYIPNPADGVVIAQTSVAATLSAILWARPLRPVVASWIIGIGAWALALLPVTQSLLGSFHVELPADYVETTLKYVSWMAALASLVARPHWLAIVAAGAAYALGKVPKHVEDADLELAALHLAWLGALVGMHHYWTGRRPDSGPSIDPERPRRSYARHDVAIFLASTALAALVCVLVLDRFCNSGDEWADTYQADLFAHFHAYRTPPSCPSLFRNYWVFFHMGRAFSQYTPGWPLFMAPFERMGVVWLATPAAFGLLCVAVARLARRVAAGSAKGERAAPEAEVGAAGILAAGALMLSGGVLLNAGSRFPHIFVATTFAWAAETSCALATPGISRRAQWLEGLLLGSAAALLLATRPPDGAAIGVALFLYFAFALARGRIGWRALLGTTAGFAFWGGLTLIILRLQIGVWFRTGYSIADQFISWAKPKLDLPHPSEFRFGVPLATSAYMWFPCAPALGAAGLFAARGRARGVSFMLVVGALGLATFYLFVRFGRWSDAGYGPRYHLAEVVPMAVGTGAALAALWGRARAHALGKAAFRAAGPITIGVAALLYGAARLGALIYPEAYAEIRPRDATLRAIARERLHDAVVTVRDTDVAFQSWDLAQNLPMDPHPDVVILNEWKDLQEEQCARRLYPDRRFYKAIGKAEVQLVPY